MNHQAHLDHHMGATLTDLLGSSGKSVFPQKLDSVYPRIVKAIAIKWAHPQEATHYFNELLLTNREKRQGFPFHMYWEIFALSNYYAKLYPDISSKDPFMEAFDVLNT